MSEGPQGSKNPFILRNYRFIYPSEGRVLSVNTVNNRDISLQFKIDGSPVILTYESDLIIRVPMNPSTSFAALKDQAKRLLSGETTTVPPYRIKAKSLGTVVKDCRANISNFSFYSVNTPMYLTEGLYRKTPRFIFSHPDAYTTESCIPLEPLPSSGTNPRIYPITYNLSPAGTIAKQWDNTSYVTPIIDPQGRYVFDFRIPFTDLLPCFKAGVLPLMMINSNVVDMNLTIFNPLSWLVPVIFSAPTEISVFLSLTTVALPDLNPLAELLVTPHLSEKRFRAPYLDYNVFDRIIQLSPTFLAGTQSGNASVAEFNFNILQYYRNVPFISISFLDMSSEGSITTFKPGVPPDQMLKELSLKNYQSADVKTTAEQAGGRETKWPPALGQSDGQGGRLPTQVSDLFNIIEDGPVNPWSKDGIIPLDAQDRERGGFYTLPPCTELEDINVRLGPSSFPITQWPLDSNMAYLMNRKHFEMYGRRYNETRVTNGARMSQGDATLFFDLSHGPFGGFQIDSDNPLQVSGRINASNAFITNDPINIRVMLTIWFSNHFVIDLDSGGVYMEQ